MYLFLPLLESCWCARARLYPRICVEIKVGCAEMEANTLRGWQLKCSCGCCYWGLCRKRGIQAVLSALEVVSGYVGHTSLVWPVIIGPGF